MHFWDVYIQTTMYYVLDFAEHDNQSICASLIVWLLTFPAYHGISNEVNDVNMIVYHIIAHLISLYSVTIKNILNASGGIWCPRIEIFVLVQIDSNSARWQIEISVLWLSAVSFYVFIQWSIILHFMYGLTCYILWTLFLLIFTNVCVSHNIYGIMFLSVSRTHTHHTSKAF